MKQPTAGMRARSARRACPRKSGAQIKNEDWSLVCERFPWVSRWPLACGISTSTTSTLAARADSASATAAPAALGAALANRKHGRLTVTIQNDGDLMYAPGVLWTSAHHQIPLLSVMHNNRAYHQEVMHVQRMADRHNRGISRAIDRHDDHRPRISTSPGWPRAWAFILKGPITDPKDLGPAISARESSRQARRARTGRGRDTAALVLFDPRTILISPRCGGPGVQFVNEKPNSHLRLPGSERVYALIDWCVSRVYPWLTTIALLFTTH